MRRPAVVALMLGVIGLSSVIAVVTFRAPDDGDATPTVSKPSSRELPGPSEPTPPPRGSLSLRGRVLTEDGAPAPGVEVSASRALPGESLSALPCGKDVETPLSSSACEDPRALHDLRGLIDEGRGTAPLLTRATTAQDGTFVLEGLPEGSVALWAVGPQGSALELDVETHAQDVELLLQPSAVFSSRVVDEAVRPVVDASVTLFHAEHSRYFETRTDAEGRFRIGPLPESDYALVVSSPGFLTAHQTNLVPEELSAEDLVLHRPRRILGQVLLDERPVPGVQVRAHDSDYEPESDSEDPLTSITDADGRFILEDMAPGSYVLRARRGDQQGETETTLAEEQADVEVTLHLGTVVKVVGQVRDEAGQPIPDALVTLNTHGDVSTSTDVTTEADGRFVFNSATLGHNDFTVSAVGHQFLSVSDVVVTATPAPLDFTLKRAFVMEGLVTDTEGNPLTEAEVIAMPSRHDSKLRRDGTPASFEAGDVDDPFNNAESVYTSTDENGRFVHNLAEPGLHRLKAQALGFLDTEWQQAQVPSQDVRLVMKRGASVEGTVETTDGAPLPAIQVSLVEDGKDSAGTTEAVTDARGSFSLRGIAPGRYSLRAIRNRGGPPRASLSVVLVGAETKTVTLRLEPGLSLSGLVVDEAGKPMPGAEIHAYVPSEDGARPRFFHHGRSPFHDASSAITDEQGRFTLEHLSPTPCRLSVRKEGYQLIAEPLQGDESARSRTPQVIAAAGSTNVKLVLRYQGGIRGRLVREDRTPITRFEVNEEFFREPDGTFHIPVEEPGRTWLTLEAPGLARVLREVHVEPGQDTDLGDVVLKAGRRLRGRVLDAATSAPVVGVEVQAYLPLTPSAGEEDPEEQSLAHARTAADGAFELPPMESGASFRLEASHPDYLPLSRQVGPGETTLELRVSTGARLDGTVKDREGRPVSTFLYLHPLSPAGAEAVMLEEDGGDFHATGLAPGEYTLIARETTTQQGDTVRFMPLRVKLGPGERKVIHLQELDGGATLKLRPSPLATNPTHAVTVIRYHLFAGTVPAPGSWEELEHLAETLGIPTASDTTSTFEHLPAGRYTYVLMGRNHLTPHWVIHRAEVDLPAQGVVTPDIQPTWLPLSSSDP
ncbi:carboxypeptidase regulatory-like domain-containing protein [Myxococcus sp. CA056]|uniref:carboxypeptidase-like regulatory domain-containing protein n=1 Tax=Myxococcus sp. CA056 TaxID=2741740 RepID=UPI00157A8426|nr:carboxypeptidase-like regulatory domain-containing protein [Myxococcus sp. CA056]NTX10382.1 carboxypeptidase regulatory-like domain-containing protein [Myxococcus sp. CA056]